MAGSGALYDAFAEVARRQELCVAIVGEPRNLTYLALKTAIDKVAAAMAAHGMGGGRLTVADFTRPELNVITLFAASRIGADLAFAPLADASRLSQKVDFKLTDDGIPPAQRDDALVVDQSWFAPRAGTSLPASAARDAARLIFGTSGSTGERKYVALSEGQILGRLQGRQSYIGPDTRLLCTIGSRTAVTIESRVAALLAGGSIAVLPINADLPHHIDVFAISTMMSTPLIVDDLIKMDLPKRIFSSLKTLTIGGASPAPALLQAASERICSNIIIGYGNTELGSIAQYRYSRGDYARGKVGKVLPDIEMMLADGHGPAVTGQVGQIRIRRPGAKAVAGYVSAGGHADPGRFTKDGWFVPGDLGVMDAEGNLTLAGRDDDVINASGNKYSIDLIESVIEEKTGCRCAVLRGERTEAGETLTVVIDSTRPVRASDVLALAKARFLRLDIGAVYVVAEIKTTDAKKDRTALARLLGTEPGLFRRL